MKFWLGDTINESAPNGGAFDVAPELGYLGATISGNPAEGSNSPFVLFVGPNFRFAASAAVQPSLLEIFLTASNTVLLRWPVTDTLGQLQTTSDLYTAMTNVPTPLMMVGSNKVVELPATEARSYFRLSYP